MIVGLLPTAWPSGPGVFIFKSQRWDSNPHAPLYRRGARPVERHWHQGGRWESNPHNPGSQPGLAAALSSATVLQPGIEPGTRPSQGRVMSLSPSKQGQYPGQESNLDLLLRREP